MIVPIEAASQGLLSKGVSLYLACQGLLTGEAVGQTPAGAPSRGRRYILPDGRVVWGENKALAALEVLLRADLNSRVEGSEKTRLSPLVANMPLPELIASLPDRRRENLDPALLEAVRRRQEEEEVILTLLLME